MVRRMLVVPTCESGGHSLSPAEVPSCSIVHLVKASGLPKTPGGIVTVTSRVLAKGSLFSSSLRRRLVVRSAWAPAWVSERVTEASSSRYSHGSSAALAVAGRRAAKRRIARAARRNLIAAPPSTCRGGAFAACGGGA